MEDGTALDGQDGRPKVDKYVTYQYQEMFDTRDEARPEDDGVVYFSKQIPGYEVVGPTEIKVPYQQYGQRTNVDVVFKYRKITTNIDPQIDLNYTVGVTGLNKEETFTTSYEYSSTPQMTTKIWLSNRNRELNRAKLEITFDNEFISQSSIQVASGEATEAWYTSDGIKIKDNRIEIQLHENIPTGQEARGIPVSLHFLRSTPHKGYTNATLKLYNVNDKGQTEVIAISEPIRMTLEYTQPKASSHVVRANSVQNENLYTKYFSYEVISGKNRVVANDSELRLGFTAPSGTASDFDYFKQTVTLPEYTAIDDAGNEVKKLATFDATKNPGWVLQADGRTLVYEKEVASTSRHSVALNDLVLNIPHAKIDSPINYTSKFETRNAADAPHKHLVESTLASTTVYPSFHREYVRGDIGVSKYTYNDSGVYVGDTYYPGSYDLQSTREKEKSFIVTGTIADTENNENIHYKEFKLVDYNLDSRLKYQTVSFTSSSDSSYKVTIQGYRKNGDKPSLQQDTKLFELESTSKSETPIVIPDDTADYLVFVYGDNNNTVITKGSYSAIINTELKDSNTELTNDQNKIVALSNSGALSYSARNKDTDEKVSTVTRDQYKDTTMSAFSDNPYITYSTSYYFIQYDRTARVDKTLTGEFGGNSNAAPVIAGKQGSYDISLNTFVAKKQQSFVNETIIENFEAIDVIPEGVEINKDDVQLSTEFLAAGGTFTMTDNYQTIENGETVTRRAIIFKATRLDLYKVSGTIATIQATYTGLSNNNTSVNKVYATWTNQDLVPIERPTTASPDGQASTVNRSYSDATLIGINASSLEAKLYIRKVSDDTTENLWSSSGIVTESGQAFDYKMSFRNYGDKQTGVPVKGLDAINIFPGPNDIKLNKTGERNSFFANTLDTARLAEMIIPDGYVVKYLNSSKSTQDLLLNKTVSDLANDDSLWGDQPTADVKGLRLVAKEGTELASGEEVNLIIPMKAPVTNGLSDQRLGKKAIDSFAYRTLNLQQDGTYAYNNFAERNSVYNEMLSVIGSIQFTKYGKEGTTTPDDRMAPLQGAMFAVAAKDSPSKIIATKVSDDQGIVLFENLPINKTYIVTEISAPDNYVKSTQTLEVTTADFERFADSNYAYVSDARTFLNVKPLFGSIVIIKKAAKDIVNLPNIPFKIERIEPAPVGNEGVFYQSTNEEGKIIISNLPEGRYRITELATAGEDRFQVAEPQVVTIGIDTKVVETKVVNDKFDTVLRVVEVNQEADLSKEDNWNQLSSFGRKAIADVTAKIVSEDGSEIPLTTNRDGRIVVKGLTPGQTYKLVFDTVPSLYKNNSTEYQFTITDDGKIVNTHNSKAFRQSGLNLPLIRKDIVGRIEVLKTDFETGEALEGATIQLSKLQLNDKGLVVGSEVLTTKVTVMNDQNHAVAVFDNLEPGTYAVQEISAPAGYVVNTSKKEVVIPKAIDAIGSDSEIKDENTIRVIRNTEIKDQKVKFVAIKGSDVKGKINIPVADAERFVATNPEYKVRRISSSIATVYRPLSGVKFHLYKMENGQKVGNPIEIDGNADILTDEQGTISIGTYKLEYETTYGLYEIETIEGYKLVTTPKVFNVKEMTTRPGSSREISLFVNNEKITGSILISKYDVTAKRGLDGAVFQLFKGGKDTVDSTNPYMEISTSNLGYAYFNDLEVGTYTVREKTAPQGYGIIEQKDFEFTISEGNKHHKQIVYNAKTVSFDVSKVWVGGSEASATIQLQAARNNETNYAPFKLEGITNDDAKVVLNQGNNWRFRFENLLDGDQNGAKLTYNVVETDLIENTYDTTITGTQENGFVVTNVFKEENKKSVGATKIWSTGEGFALPNNVVITVELRKTTESIPANLTKEFIASTSVVNTVLLNKENNWQHVFTGLTAREGGQEVNYIVVEKDVIEGVVAHYQFNQDTNSWRIENQTATRNITVEKLWEGVNPTDAPRVIFELYKSSDLNNPISSRIAELDGDNKLIASFNDVTSVEMIQENGVFQTRAIEYVVKEKYADQLERPGYVLELSSNKTVDEYKNDLTSDIIFTANNKQVKQDIDVKINWYSNNPSDQVEVKLYSNGKLVNTPVVITENPDGTWTYKFPDMPVYEEDGRTPIVYTIEEQVIGKHSSKVTRKEIPVANRKVPNTLFEIDYVELIEIRVQKTWENYTAQAGDKVVAVLFRNNEIVDELELNQMNQFTSAFANLPIVDLDTKEELIYRVDEKDVVNGIVRLYGHQFSVKVEENSGHYTIINTRINLEHPTPVSLPQTGTGNISLVNPIVLLFVGLYLLFRKEERD